MPLPLVSVVVAVKDGAEYLPAALHSIVAQGYRPLEIIVVDGGSRDRTVDIARSFDAVRVVQQPGSGIADAYNTGTANAQGDLIAFLSSDDVWTADKLEAQVGYMLAHPHLKYTVGKVRFVLEPGVQMPPGFRAELLHGEHTALIMETLVAHRSVWTEVGCFDTRLSLAEDVDWFSRARQLGLPMAVVPRVLLHKRIHGANASLDVTVNNRELLRVVRRSIRRNREARAESSRVGHGRADAEVPPKAKSVGEDLIQTRDRAGTPIATQPRPEHGRRASPEHGRRGGAVGLDRPVLRSPAEGGRRPQD